MNINDLTIGQAKELSKMFGNTQVNDDSHWEIGKNYLIRTVTMTHPGKLEKVTDKEVVLSSAAWIADTGRFHDALKNGIENNACSEVEPFINHLIIGRGAIVDATIYDNGLIKEQK